MATLKLPCLLSWENWLQVPSCPVLQSPFGEHEAKIYRNYLSTCFPLSQERTGFEIISWLTSESSKPIQYPLLGRREWILTDTGGSCQVYLPDSTRLRCLLDPSIATKSLLSSSTLIVNTFLLWKTMATFLFCMVSSKEVLCPTTPSSGIKLSWD